MKINLKMTLKVFFMAGITSLLIGCAMLPKEKMASHSTEYNLVVEKVRNEMLLLNILRASKRHPMHFTSFNVLRGSMTYQFETGGLNIPFGSIGEGLNGSYSIAPKVSYSTSPNFDLVVWDSQEFINGIMTPVCMETFNYYWEQGWPREMLLHLFVRKIEQKTKDGKLVSFENYPGNEKKFKEFQEELRALFFGERRCTLGSKLKPDNIGPEIEKSDVANLKYLIEVQKAGLKLEEIKGKDGEKTRYQLKSEKSTYEFDCGEEPTYKFYLRSPEAILYYLGEIMRAETENKFTPKIRVCESQPEKEAPLFVVSVSSGNDKDASVAVEYDGTQYIIPEDLPADSHDGCRVGRSMHVLSLISQLIGLQQKGPKAPVTGVVTVIGQ